MIPAFCIGIKEISGVHFIEAACSVGLAARSRAAVTSVTRRHRQRLSADGHNKQPGINPISPRRTLKSMSCIAAHLTLITSHGARRNILAHNCGFLLITRWSLQVVLVAIMPGPTNTLLIEGTFEELADELSQYIDDVKRKISEDSATLKAEVSPLLEQGQKDEALKKLVTGSSALNSAPEKGMPGIF